MKATVYVFLFLLISQQTGAHHSFATHYDSKNVVEITGTLTEVSLRNPHSFFSVSVKNTDGSTSTWEVESHAVPLLNRLGMTRKQLKVGDVITIWGPRSRKPEKNLLFGAQYLTADGQEFEILDSVRRPPAKIVADERGVQGLEKFTGMWLTFIEGQAVTDTPLKLNQAGKKARLNFDPTNTSAMRCIPPNVPAALFLPYNYIVTLDGQTITFLQEYQNIRRSVTVGSQAPDESMPDYGSRLATFDGSVLTITSTDFTANEAGLASGWEPNGNGYDIPASDQKTFVERYRLNEDGSQMIMNYTLADPVYLEEPYSNKITWYRLPDDTPENEIVCDTEIAERSTRNAVREN